MSDDIGHATDTVSPDTAAPDAPTGDVTSPAATGDDAPLTDAEYADLLSKINVFDALPDNLRQDPNIAKFKEGGLEALAKAHVSAVGMIGRDKVPLPQAGDEASWDAWFKAAGRPDTHDGYEFKKADGLPEGFEYDQNVEAGFKEVAHKAGLNVQQAQTLRDFYVNMAAQGFSGQVANAEAARAQTVEELQKEWGNAMPQKLSIQKTTA